MTNEEKILAILTEMKSDMTQMKDDMATMKTDLAELKEDQQATRDGVNSLLDWAEECGNVIKFPLPKVK